ncbi:hypothetical protein F4604DRAFT_1694724 [Suillus subluteus]|nr:hypothetical protein F4604DRAFT_1694724 [Suillus subluteus]
MSTEELKDKKELELKKSARQSRKNRLYAEQLKACALDGGPFTPHMTLLQEAGSAGCSSDESETEPDQGPVYLQKTPRLWYNSLPLEAKLWLNIKNWDWDFCNGGRLEVEVMPKTGHRDYCVPDPLDPFGKRRMQYFGNTRYIPNRRVKSESRHLSNDSSNESDPKSEVDTFKFNSPASYCPAPNRKGLH